MRTESLTLVRASEYRVAGPGATLAALGVGSCVIAILHDAGIGVGGLAHPLLPTPPANGRGKGMPARYGSTALPLLLAGMLEAGAAAGAIYARLVGGASMFGPLLTEEGRSLGMRNADALRSALAAASIPVRAEALGGERGRSVYLSTATGELRVRSIGVGDVVL